MKGARPRYDEGWQGKLYRWFGRRVELLARRVRYTHRRFDLRYHVLDPLADRLVWKAMRRAEVCPRQIVKGATSFRWWLGDLVGRWISVRLGVWIEGADANG